MVENLACWRTFAELLIPCGIFPTKPSVKGAADRTARRAEVVFILLGSVAVSFCFFFFVVHWYAFGILQFAFCNLSCCRRCRCRRSFRRPCRFPPTALCTAQFAQLPSVPSTMATLAAFRLASRRVGSAAVARSAGLARSRWMSSYPPHEVVGMPSLSPVRFAGGLQLQMCAWNMLCQSADAGGEVLFLCLGCCVID